MRNPPKTKLELKVLTLLISFIFFGGSGICYGQYLRVDFTDGSHEIYQITDVMSIKAQLDSVQLSLTNGSLFTWAGTDIRKMNHVAVVTEVDELTKEQALTLFPNPSSGAVTITLDVAQLTSSANTLEVFDLNGQLIKQIPFQANAGNSSIVWNGTDQTNSVVPNGTYLCVINDKEKRFTQKVVIQK